MAGRPAPGHVRSRSLRVRPGPLLQHAGVLGAAAVGDARPLGLARRQDRAARVEPAAPGHVLGIRRLPRQEHGRAPRVRQDRQQGARVGVGRRGEDLLHRAGLHDPPQVHHRDPVGDVPGQSQVVRGDQGRQPQVGAQVEQQAQDLAAHRRVQGGDGLVGHQDLGLQDERARDHDPLALAAGQLVRVGGQEPLGRPQPRPGQRPSHAVGLVGRRALVDAQPLGHGLVDGAAGVERAGGVLLDQLHPPPVGAQVARAVAQRHALEEHPPGRRALQAQEEPRERGLAAARLPDQGDDLPGPHIQVHAVDGPCRAGAADEPGPGGEGDLHALRAEHGHGRSGRVVRGGRGGLVVRGGRVVRFGRSGLGGGGGVGGAQRAVS